VRKNVWIDRASVKGHSAPQPGPCSSALGPESAHLLSLGLGAGYRLRYGLSVTVCAQQACHACAASTEQTPPRSTKPCNGSEQGTSVHGATSSLNQSPVDEPFIACYNRRHTEQHTWGAGGSCNMNQPACSWHNSVELSSVLKGQGEVCIKTRF
jgi:hypothetical protein